MLYPVDNEIRQVKSLDGIWRFKKEPIYSHSCHTYRTQLLQSARKQLCGIRADVRNQKVDETAGSDVETKSWK